MIEPRIASFNFRFVRWRCRLTVCSNASSLSVSSRRESRQCANFPPTRRSKYAVSSDFLRRVGIPGIWRSALGQEMRIVSLIDEEDSSSASCAISGSGKRGVGVHSGTDHIRKALRKPRFPLRWVRRRRCLRLRPGKKPLPSNGTTHLGKQARHGGATGATGDPARERGLLRARDHDYRSRRALPSHASLPR